MNTQEEKSPKNFILKSYTRKELCDLYGIPDRTFAHWIKPYKKEWGIDKQRYMTVKQVKLIIETFGLPGVINME